MRRRTFKGLAAAASVLLVAAVGCGTDSGGDGGSGGSDAAPGSEGFTPPTSR